MAHCEAEGRKHPTMDLYAGIFNSKLYTSSRGSTHAGSVDKWSRNGFNGASADGDSFHEDKAPADRSAFQTRSFRDKPPVLSDHCDFNRNVTPYSNGGSTRFGSKTCVIEMGYEGMERKSSPRADVGHVNNDRSGLISDVNSLGNGEKLVQSNMGYNVRRKSSLQPEVAFGMNNKSIAQTDRTYASGHSQIEAVHTTNEKKNLHTEIVNGSRVKENLQRDIGCSMDVENNVSSNAGYGPDGKLSQGARMGYENIDKKTPQLDVVYGGAKQNGSAFQASRGTSWSQKTAKGSHNNLSKGIDDNLFNECDITRTSEMNYEYREAGIGIAESRGTEILPVHGLQKSPQVITKGALLRSIGRGTNAGPVSGRLCNSDDVVGDDNVNATKSQECTIIDGQSLSPGAGLMRIGKTPDMVSVRRSFSSTGESVRCERNLESVVPTNGAVSADRIAGGDTVAHSSVPDLCNTASFHRSGELNAGARSESLQVDGRRSSNKIQIDLSNGRGTLSEKCGELMMGFSNANSCVKAGNVGEVEQGYMNGPALKNSPSRGHNFVANLRVSSSGSADSSSSHGGSSHSGSPTAAESIRDSKVSSFGNILVSKGSPHSVSSRSMGSSSVSGNGVFATTKSSFIDIHTPQFRYSTTSGRKSAEIVPNRRTSEMGPIRKSSEMIPNGHYRGAAVQGFVGDGMLNFGNVSRGSGNLSNGNNISLKNGNLLVGSANGSVLTVGGGAKSSNKQGEVVNQTHTADCTLLKKAQSSSDPEEIKNAGNEFYRRGHLSEALIVYSRAVTLCPNNAAYRSNRAAALSGLGRLGEAVQECEDAIRLDYSYVRAHQRAAALYLRLGLLEGAKRHFNATGPETDLMDVQRLHNIDGHISGCIEARRRGEWQTVIRECDAAVVSGADSAPQIFGYKSEALLGLHKPDDADAVCTAAQRVEKSLVKLGILPADPFLLIVRAHIDMTLGRFEGAVEAAKLASKINPCNDNAAALLRKTQAVCKARATGNDLFKAERFFEALVVYAEGLESDPTNAVLLCNRAACRSKLGQWEKAVEDCNAALRVQPNYTKALMRRANCWAKLERWEDALEDYDLLRRKMPEDLEVARGLFDVHVAIKKSHGEDTHKMKFGGDVQEVSTDEEYQEAISSPGLLVVQFITRWSERCQQLSPFVDDLCKRNPCVNFVKVDVEEVPYLAKIETVSFIPTFKIYKNGQKLKEILGPTEQSLECALRHYAL